MDWSSGGSREGAQGEGGGGGRDPPFSRPSWKKKILETVPPFSKGLDDRLPPPQSPPSTYLKVWIQHYEVITLQRYKIYKLILHFLSCCLAYKLK